MRNPGERVSSAQHPAAGATGLAHARQRILTTATNLFAERGFQATTIRDLAALAGVNIAAVNYHFRSKEELYTQVIDNALSQWSAEVVGVEDLDEGASLERLVTGIFEALLSPVFERPNSRAIVRLLAWSLLDRPSELNGGRINAFAIVLAQLLSPHLPANYGTEKNLFLAQWLIGQCLLISPDLRPGRELSEAQKADLFRTSVCLALGGLNAIIGTGGKF